MVKIFDDRDIATHTNITASYMQQGWWSRAIRQVDTIWYKILKSLSSTFKTLDTQINATGLETFPDETIDLIERWEKDLGIPDDIFDNSGTLEQRRNNVIIKLAGLGVQTAEDFVNVAKLIGYDNVVISAAEVAVFPLSFPIPFFPSAKNARFTIYVDLPKSAGLGFFPLPFPATFASGQDNAIERLFNKLKPANVQLIFRYIL